MANLNLSVSILIAFLKHYGVRHLVLSPGTRNIPFVATVEVDPFFICHSVVDERNAAFFALGLAQACHEPVGLACTSGTAVSNYLTGLTEADQSNTPVLALTCDRSPYVLGQLETQKIDQVGALRSVVRYSADLPVLKDHDDVWYFERLLNAAFHALKGTVPGPVHVNLPLVGDTNAMWSGEGRAAVERSIKYIDRVAEADAAAWEAKRARLASVRRVLVVVGQTFPDAADLSAALDRFAAAHPCVVLADNLANVACSHLVPPEAVVKGLSPSSFKNFLPDLVITVGLNFQERIKDLLKAHAGAFEHWDVGPADRIRDCFRSETAFFVCSPIDFLTRMAAATAQDASASQAYHDAWTELADRAVADCLPVRDYGNLFAVQSLMAALPDRALLHLSILNAVRLGQFFPQHARLDVYANVSTFGIDGCLPTFLGQAAAQPRKPAFLVIGDVSFFYAMNALAIRDVGSNVHVFLVNNGGAAEFHIPPASHAIPTIDRHIGVAHGHTAQAWAESAGYEYLCARDAASLLEGLPRFVRADNVRPVLFEVFTDLHRDGEAMLQLYRDLESGLRGKDVVL